MKKNNLFYAFPSVRLPFKTKKNIDARLSIIAADHCVPNI